MVAGEVSTWRPPWFETITAAGPDSAAMRASSGCTMPLSTTGSLLIEASHSMSFHESCGSKSERT